MAIQRGAIELAGLTKSYDGVTSVVKGVISRSRMAPIAVSSVRPAAARRPFCA